MGRRCRYCGASGHYTLTCPLGPATVLSLARVRAPVPRLTSVRIDPFAVQMFEEFLAHPDVPGGCVDRRRLALLLAIVEARIRAHRAADRAGVRALRAHPR